MRGQRSCCCRCRRRRRRIRIRIRIRGSRPPLSDAAASSSAAQREGQRAQIGEEVGDGPSGPLRIRIRAQTRARGGGDGCQVGGRGSARRAWAVGARCAPAESEGPRGSGPVESHLQKEGRTARSDGLRAATRGREARSASIRECIRQLLVSVCVASSPGTSPERGEGWGLGWKGRGGGQRAPHRRRRHLPVGLRFEMFEKMEHAHAVWGGAEEAAVRRRALSRSFHAPRGSTTASKRRRRPSAPSAMRQLRSALPAEFTSSVSPKPEPEPEVSPGRGEGAPHSFLPPPPPDDVDGLSGQGGKAGEPSLTSPPSPPSTEAGE